MTIAPVDFSAFLAAIMWPLITVIVVLVLRKPLVGTIGSFGGRIQKISVAGVSLELAELSQVKPEALDTEIRRLEAAPMVQSGPSALIGLLRQLGHGGKRDYMVLDLGSETTPRWLTSRAYLLAFLITWVGRPMPLVFVETTGNTRRRFIGTAPADRVRWVLGHTYPWLASASHAAFPSLGELQQDPQSGFPADWQIGALIQNFLTAIRVVPPPAAGVLPTQASTNPDWVSLADGTQEHAKWLDGERAERLLGADLLTSSVTLLPNTSFNDLTQPVLRQSGQFVAVVDSDRKFLTLINRLTVLEEWAKQTASLAKNGIKQTSPSHITPHGG